ncbi:MAG TPA: hypothetical protein PJ982_08180 [Lacipirellulaceae bacterium]|nr:hypothetical protein [Lacipirellulaceae bacterium]
MQQQGLLRGAERSLQLLKLVLLLDDPLASDDAFAQGLQPGQFPLDDVEALHQLQELALGSYQIFMREAELEHGLAGRHGLSFQRVNGGDDARERRRDVDLRLAWALHDDGREGDRSLKITARDLHGLIADVAQTLRTHLHQGPLFVIVVVVIVVVVVVMVVVVMVVVLVVCRRERRGDVREAQPWPKIRGACQHQRGQGQNDAGAKPPPSRARGSMRHRDETFPRDLCGRRAWGV